MVKFLLLAAALAASGAASATGFCPIKDSGSLDKWQPKETLEKKLVGEGWQVRRIKVDAACYEVYATDPSGKRVEAYFDPRTLEPAKP